jgi:hypothetical protein
MNILFVDVPTEQLQLVVDLVKQHLYKYTPVSPIDLGDCFQKYILVDESARIEIYSGSDLLFIKWVADVS